MQVINNVKALKEPDIILDSFMVATEVLALVATTPMIVVSKNTADYGEKYVARLWRYVFDEHIELRHEPTKYVIIADSLTEISNHIPWFLNFIPRFLEDDDCIVGVFL